MPLLALLLTLGALAADTSAPPASIELPKEMETQEQYVLLAAKVKSLGEVQDVILKQQELILQHLQELRQQVDALQSDRTNAVTRTDLNSCLDKIEQLRKRLDAEREATMAAAASPPMDAPAKTNLVRGPTLTNAVIASRYQGYRVQPGDTLSKVLLRINESFESQGLQRLTQDQVERANPGLNTERIRVGQMILIPIPDAKP